MNRREMFLRTRGHLLPFILSIIVIVFTETIMVICGIFFNRKSRFCMEGTEVKFLENGFEYVTQHWNNRMGE